MKSWAFLVDSVPFTKAVVAGETSLGGSESACLGVARALRAKGDDVHLFVTKLDDNAYGRDATGVVWHHLEEFVPMNQFVDWDVVVGLRMYPFFQFPIHARMRILWNQDLLPPKNAGMVMSVAWNLDQSLYVSEYHRTQWEDILPEIKSIGAVTRNGFDPRHVPTDAVKDPNTIIHISRPERGMAPILKMWPELRKRNPNAVLKLCRYSSMYDAKGWGKVCQSFDDWTQEVQDAVGGIVWLGELNKAQLYREIASSAVMWYPGIANFAETSCIAAIEAQACGTPFVGSLRGALPETVPAGVLIEGDAERDEAYHEASVSAVLSVMDDCKRNAVAYRDAVAYGRKHVESYTYDAIAAEWDAQIDAWFAKRYEANKLSVLRGLMHEEDSTAAKVVAQDIIKSDPTTIPGRSEDGWGAASGDVKDLSPAVTESARALAQCYDIIHGTTCGPEDYARHAVPDPIFEMDHIGRFKDCARYFEKATRLLDVACGNGAGALTFATQFPDLHVVGIDYSEENIARAKAAAETLGLSERCQFHVAKVWDFEHGKPAHELESHPVLYPYDFDALFVGEFVEHIADCATLIDWLETFCAEGAAVVYTCPVGPFIELAGRDLPRLYTHVHHFKHDDVRQVWGQKLNCKADYCAIGVSSRGVPVGHWLIHYNTAKGKAARSRDYQTRITRQRPYPKLSVGIIARNAEPDLHRCLSSIWDIADEIVVGDTGSSDRTKDIAAEYGATVLELPDVMQEPEGFSGSRNKVLEACSGDWFMWIDADEQLTYSNKVRRYLGGEVYHGFVLHQTHLMLDALKHSDKPVRIFRNDGRTKFYGCVHEQPQRDHCNGDIHPSFLISSENPAEDLPQIAHWGYLTESIRRVKMHSRNLPLLVRDQEMFPDRELGKMLVLRDYVTISDEDCNREEDLTDKAREGYARAIQMFIKYFDDPDNKFHAVARPFYESALKRLGRGTEIEFSVAGKFGGLKDARAKPSRIWVRDLDEYERYLTWKIQDAAKPLRDEPYKTTPLVQKETVTA
jgi:glycosyltransferase involved in cell wall biosynthesis/2-polyprenyl-3-methyl-5-hydroxy-6-metoxy-1,4-benzoquinol methylase